MNRDCRALNGRGSARSGLRGNVPVFARGIVEGGHDRVRAQQFRQNDPVRGGGSITDCAFSA